MVVLAAILGNKEGNHHGQPRKITVRKGAVVADHEVCSRIGRYILKRKDVLMQYESRV